jgi:hypothetical protein
MVNVGCSLTILFQSETHSFAGCGDVALAKSLKEQGVKLTQAHPLLNGDKPSTFSYGPNDHWCQPVITMHGLVPQEISMVWRFERQRELILNDLNVCASNRTFDLKVNEF